MDLPEPTPEGMLIRRVRESLRPRLPVAEAARRAGISAETWGNVERGYRTPKKNQPIAVVATGQTLAHMANEVGLTPDDLKRLGRANADQAAEILVEMRGPAYEVETVKLDRGRLLLTVDPELSEEDRELVRRQGEELAAFLARRRRSQGAKE